MYQQEHTLRSIYSFKNLNLTTYFTVVYLYINARNVRYQMKEKLVNNKPA